MKMSSGLRSVRDVKSVDCQHTIIDQEWELLQQMSH